MTWAPLSCTSGARQVNSSRLRLHSLTSPLEAAWPPPVKPYRGPVRSQPASLTRRLSLKRQRNASPLSPGRRWTSADSNTTESTCEQHEAGKVLVGRTPLRTPGCLFGSITRRGSLGNRVLLGSIHFFCTMFPFGSGGPSWPPTHVSMLHACFVVCVPRVTVPVYNCNGRRRARSRVRARRPSVLPLSVFHAHHFHCARARPTSRPPTRELPSAFARFRATTMFRAILASDTHTTAVGPVHRPLTGVAEFTFRDGRTRALATVATQAEPRPRRSFASFDARPR